MFIFSVPCDRPSSHAGIRLSMSSRVLDVSNRDSSNVASGTSEAASLSEVLMRLLPLLAKRAVCFPASSNNGIKNNFFITFNLLILSMLQRYRGMRQNMIDTSSVFVTLLRKIGIMSGPSPAHILPDKRESNAGTALIRIDKHCPRSLQGRTGGDCRLREQRPSCEHGSPYEIPAVYHCIVSHFFCKSRFIQPAVGNVFTEDCNLFTVFFASENFILTFALYHHRGTV